MDTNIYNSRYNSNPNANLSHLLHPVKIKELIIDWLKEDTPGFDFAGFVVGEKINTAILWCKDKGVLAGSPFFEAVFEILNCEVNWEHEEGVHLNSMTKVCTVTGKARNILLGERLALNIMARASGIATYAHHLKEIISNTNWKGEIAGTRKTTPGFRMVEKYSLLVGGISTHRYDLSSMVMLKDNHIWSAGNISQAVKDARSVCGFSSKIEVECSNLQEGVEAAANGADIVMLDNFTPEKLFQTAKELRSQFPNIILEASGGINDSNILQYINPYVDIISLSKTTQGYDVIDFSLKIQKMY